MRGEVLGVVERRRRWSVGEKLAVVRASLEPGAVISEVARRFDVTRRQVYDWRRAARRGDLGAPGGVAGFLEVLPDAMTSAPAPSTGGVPLAAPSGVTADAADATVTSGARVEVGLGGGRLLRFPAGLPTDEVRRLIRAVEGA